MLLVLMGPVVLTGGATQINLLVGQIIASSQDGAIALLNYADRINQLPLGVIGIIYESRPNVTSDAAVLCLKAGNATILRGGSEALSSNCAIAECLVQGIAAAGQALWPRPTRSIRKDAPPDRP